eukprot:TRINITY_DN2375_c0_g1_i1.p1 TRINITY_DN2375_c0_g1~~TRINITY_DN2375_c0_g1_i1.p1  ORF type:complete len:134 (-),score=29.25 TRINITY_DN2375_c0_g1_i1:66-467(-)
MSYKFPIQKFLDNCSDAPSVISETTKQDLEKKLKEVFTFNPTFGKDSWSIYELNSILEERKKHIQLLNAANFGELKEHNRAPNSQILDIYSRFNRAHQEGFWKIESGKWTVKDLKRFEKEIQGKLELLTKYYR